MNYIFMLKLQDKKSLTHSMEGVKISRLIKLHNAKMLEFHVHAPPVGWLYSCVPSH